MRLSFFLSLVVAQLTFWGFALGQQQTPACAAQCLKSSLEAQSVCTPTNITCICTDPSLNAAIQGCVLQSCTMKETLTALNVTATLCGQPVRDNTRIISVVAATTGGAALLLVLLRIYTALTAGTFGLDDGAAATAGALLIAINALTMFLGPAGIGRDIWYLEFKDIYRSVKLLFFCQLLVWPLSAVTKLTFLFFYLRIFPRREVRYAVFVLLGLTFCWFITFEIGNIFNCTPISFFWNGWDGEHPGSCIDKNSFIYAGSSFNIAIDLAIIVLPLTELYKLQLNAKKKVAIMAMFSVGCFTTVVAIVRLVKLKQYAKTANPTYELVDPDIWTMIELNVGVFCACMPSIRHFLTRHFPACFSTVHGSKDYTPNVRPSNGYASNRSGQRTPMHKFSITKTVDTSVQRVDEDDEVELVQYGQSRQHNPPSSTNSNEKETVNYTHWR